MEEPRFKRGDKVVPISKTIGVRIEDSSCWQRGKEQGFLYIANTYGKNNYMCNDMPQPHTGDYYRESDLISYDEEPEEAINEEFDPEAFNQLFNQGE